MNPLTDDNTVWPEDLPPASSSYPNVAPPAPPDSGFQWSALSLPGILSNLWATAKGLLHPRQRTGSRCRAQRERRR